MFANDAGDVVPGVEHMFKMALLAKRTLVFDLGDPAKTVFLIKRGRVRIARLAPSGKDVTIALLGSGDIFGEEGLFGARERKTIAVCAEETLLCSAHAEDLFALLARDPQIAINVAEILNDRLIDAAATIEDLSAAKVPERLMSLFGRLAEEHGVRVPGGTLLDISLTHGDIASLIGSTRETVSAEIAALVRAGRLHHDGRRLVLLDAKA